MDRLEKNRRRRLKKEKEQNNPKPTERNINSQDGGSKCDRCKDELIPPIKVYICQEGHLHKEGQPRQNKFKVLY